MIALAAVLSFTHPRFNADVTDSTGPCAPPAYQLTLDDLAATRLYGARRWGQWALVRQKGAIDMEGRADTLRVADDGVWSYYLTSVDVAGNESCASNVVTLGTTVGVDLGRPEKVEWYDVAGRRIDKPAATGIYWKVKGGHRRLILLRR